MPTPGERKTVQARILLYCMRKTSAGVEKRSCYCLEVAQVGEGGAIGGAKRGGMSEEGYDKDMATAGGGSVV